MGLLKNTVFGIMFSMLLIGMTGLVFYDQALRADQQICISLETDKYVYTLGENVTITLTNNGSERVDIGGYPAWQIFTYPEEEPVYPAIFAFLSWHLDPEENDTFIWNQYNEFNQSFVKPGAYVVRDTQGWGLSAHFEIVAAEIIVPDDYSTIQEAINHANSGDVVFVRSGTYYENVVVNKSILLIGEDRDFTIIDGKYADSVVRVTAEGVKISGFTIQNSSSEFPNSGILLSSSKGCCTRDNIIRNNKFGILVISSSNNTIINNVVVANLHGIELYYAKGNAVVNNDVLGNNAGIYLYEAHDNLVKDNIVLKNNFGIILGYSNNNMIIGNRVSKAEWSGIRVVDQSEGNFLINNTAFDNLDGLELTYANNNILISNIASHNGRYGIQVAYSNSNILICNEILNNAYGIRLSEFSSNSTIYHNNFINNTQQMYILFSPRNTTWDNDYPSGGNYWSDYNGIDLYSGPYQNETGSDGIGDTAYVIDENNVDHYPLMSPWAPTPPAPPVVNATVDVHPETLNLWSRGKWITAYIELPEGYDVADINVSSIMLNDTIPVYLKDVPAPKPVPTAIGDYDEDGIPDLMVKFDRAEVISYILANVDVARLFEERFITVTLTMTCYLNDGTPFQGSTTLRIVMPMLRGLGRRAFII